MLEVDRIAKTTLIFSLPPPNKIDTQIHDFTQIGGSKIYLYLVLLSFSILYIIVKKCMIETLKWKNGWHIYVKSLELGLHIVDTPKCLGEVGEFIGTIYNSYPKKHMFWSMWSMWRWTWIVKSISLFEVIMASYACYSNK